MRKAFFLISMFILTGCVSAEEQQAAKFRVQQTILTQCVETIGFEKGTKEYLECRTFYNTILPDLGLESGFGIDSAADFSKKIQSINAQCTQLLDSKAPKKGEIWPCAKEQMQSDVQRIVRQRELYEYQQSINYYRY